MAEKMQNEDEIDELAGAMLNESKTPPQAEKIAKKRGRPPKNAHPTSPLENEFLQAKATPPATKPVVSQKPAEVKKPEEERPKPPQNNNLLSPQAIAEIGNNPILDTAVFKLYPMDDALIAIPCDSAGRKHGVIKLSPASMIQIKNAIDAQLAGWQEAQ